MKKILNESINTREENLRSFEELEEQEKVNMDSATEIQKFMRAYNSKQGTQKMILEKHARKEIQEEQERKKHKKRKTLIKEYNKEKNKNENITIKQFYDKYVIFLKNNYKNLPVNEYDDNMLYFQNCFDIFKQESLKMECLNLQAVQLEYQSSRI